MSNPILTRAASLTSAALRAIQLARYPITSFTSFLQSWKSSSLTLWDQPPAATQDIFTALGSSGLNVINFLTDSAAFLETQRTGSTTCGGIPRPYTESGGTITIFYISSDATTVLSSGMTFQITTSGGTATSFTASPLPAGVTLDTATGLLSCEDSPPGTITAGVTTATLSATMDALTAYSTLKITLT